MSKWYPSTLRERRLAAFLSHSIDFNHSWNRQTFLSLGSYHALSLEFAFGQKQSDLPYRFDYAALSDRCSSGSNNCSMQASSVSGDSDLSTNASRPAAIAIFLIEGSLKEANMTIGTAGIICLNTAVATMSFSMGIARSITIRSGRSSLALSIASQPFSASPQMIQPGRASSNLRKQQRITALSSTIRIDFTSARFRLNTFNFHYGSRLCNRVKSVRCRTLKGSTKGTHCKPLLASAVK